VLPRSRSRFSVFEQPVVVALVQADRRLVEHVEHARQARADLAGQADALALAARQRAEARSRRQVGQADIVEEAQPLVDLLQDARGDLASAWA
jgi:ABC-type nitrate/sulfonate/bicarbonate transport system substrate-binding protein